MTIVLAVIMLPVTSFVRFRGTFRWEFGRRGSSVSRHVRHHLLLVSQRVMVARCLSQLCNGATAPPERRLRVTSAPTVLPLSQPNTVTTRPHASAPLHYTIGFTCTCLSNDTSSHTEELKFSVKLLRKP
jgi:hypothetical protein